MEKINECFNIYLRILKENKVLVAEDMDDELGYQEIDCLTDIYFMEYIGSRAGLSVYKDGSVPTAYRHMRGILDRYSPNQTTEKKSGWF